MNVIKKFIPLIIFLGLWQFGSMVFIPLFIPSPISVMTRFHDLLTSGTLLKALQYSFLRITSATSLAACISIPLGILMFQFKTFKDILSPFTSRMRFLPITAFYPLLIMWFGIGEQMKISFLFLATFVYMLPSTILCLQEVNQDLIDTGLTMGMTKLQTTYKILLPASLPSILKTFIMMYGIGWSYIAISETINAKYGLGYLINIGTQRGRTDMVFASILTIMACSIIFDVLGNWMIKKGFKWRYLRNAES